MKIDGAIEIRYRRDLIKVPDYVQTRAEFNAYVMQVKEWGNPVVRTNYKKREIVSFEQRYGVKSWLIYLHYQAAMKCLIKWWGMLMTR